MFHNIKLIGMVLVSIMSLAFWWTVYRTITDGIATLLQMP